MQALDRAGAGEPGDARAPTVVRRASDADDSERLLCAACAHPITSARARREVGGAHAHTFMNPAGLVFHIGCFAEAPGCTELGAPSTEWSWFPGAAWRIALCASCRTHVGWSFESGAAESGRFWGLILDRLVGEA